MKAMILAAGRGERMRPLTDTTPKPLLEVKGKALIVWLIEKLVKAGFEEIIINVAHLGQKIIDALGDGSKFGVKIIYSDEQREGALESAGGIVKALPILGKDTFLVVNADVWCNYEFDSSFELGNDLAHLILVSNPEHNKNGDFHLEDSRVYSNGNSKYTFSGIGYYSPKLFETISYGKSALAPLLRDAMNLNLVNGEFFSGVWLDIGIPKRLKDLIES